MAHEETVKPLPNSAALAGSFEGVPNNLPEPNRRRRRSLGHNVAGSCFLLTRLLVNNMHASWKLWTDAWQIGFDAQRVIAMRLARISAGGAAADAECRRMVSEKIAAGAAAQAAAAAALAAGKGIETAATVALAPVKRAVRANRRRLSRARRIDTIVSRLRRLLPIGPRRHRK
jgi:hypothetical protein